MNKKNVFVFNGPPRSGKDSLVEIITRTEDFDVTSFKHILYFCTFDWLRIHAKLPMYEKTFEDFMENYDRKTSHVINNESVHEWYKDYPLYETHDGKLTLSKRQALIHVSENVYKPRYGLSYFGEETNRTISKSSKDTVLVSDGGFYDEFKSIAEHNVTIFRIYRNGCNFDNDSRNYILDEDAKTLGINVIDIYNNDTLLSSVNDVMKHIF